MPRYIVTLDDSAKLGFPDLPPKEFTEAELLALCRERRALLTTPTGQPNWETTEEVHLRVAKQPLESAPIIAKFMKQEWSMTEALLKFDRKQIQEIIDRGVEIPFGQVPVYALFGFREYKTDHIPVKFGYKVSDTDFCYVDTTMMWAVKPSCITDNRIGNDPQHLVFYPVTQSKEDMGSIDEQIDKSLIDSVDTKGWNHSKVLLKDLGINERFRYDNSPVLFARVSEKEAKVVGYLQEDGKTTTDLTQQEVYDISDRLEESVCTIQEASEQLTIKDLIDRKMFNIPFKINRSDTSHTYMLRNEDEFVALADDNHREITFGTASRMNYNVFLIPEKQFISEIDEASDIIKVDLRDLISLQRWGKLFKFYRDTTQWFRLDSIEQYSKITKKGDKPQRFPSRLDDNWKCWIVPADDEERSIACVKRADSGVVMLYDLKPGDHFQMLGDTFTVYNLVGLDRAQIIKGDLDDQLDSKRPGYEFDIVDPYIYVMPVLNKGGIDNIDEAKTAVPISEIPVGGYFTSTHEGFTQHMKMQELLDKKAWGTLFKSCGASSTVTCKLVSATEYENLHDNTIHSFSNTLDGTWDVWVKPVDKSGMSEIDESYTFKGIRTADQAVPIGRLVKRRITYGVAGNIREMVFERISDTEMKCVSDSSGALVGEIAGLDTFKHWISYEILPHQRKEDVDSIDESNEDYRALKPEMFSLPTTFDQVPEGDYFLIQGRSVGILMKKVSAEKRKEHCYWGGEHYVPKQINAEWNTNPDVPVLVLPQHKEDIINIDESTTIVSYDTLQVGELFCFLGANIVCCKVGDDTYKNADPSNLYDKETVYEVGSFFRDKIIPVERTSKGALPDISIDESNQHDIRHLTPDQFTIPTTFDQLSNGSYFLVPDRATGYLMVKSSHNMREIVGKWEGTEYLERFKSWSPLSTNPKVPVLTLPVTKETVCSIDEGTFDEIQHLDPAAFTEQVFFKDIPVGTLFKPMLDSACINQKKDEHTVSWVGSYERLRKKWRDEGESQMHYTGGERVFVRKIAKSETMDIDESLELDRILDIINMMSNEGKLEESADLPSFNPADFQVLVDFSQVKIGEIFVTHVGNTFTLFRKIDSKSSQGLQVLFSTGEPVPLTYIYTAPFGPCHIRLLQKQDTTSIDESSESWADFDRNEFLKRSPVILRTLPDRSYYMYDLTHLSSEPTCLYQKRGDELWEIAVWHGDQFKAALSHPSPVNSQGIEAMVFPGPEIRKEEMFNIDESFNFGVYKDVDPNWHPIRFGERATGSSNSPAHMLPVRKSDTDSIDEGTSTISKTHSSAPTELEVIANQSNHLPECVNEGVMVIGRISEQNVTATETIDNQLDKVLDGVNQALESDPHYVNPPIAESVDCGWITRYVMDQAVARGAIDFDEVAIGSLITCAVPYPVSIFLKTRGKNDRPNCKHLGDLNILGLFVKIRTGDQSATFLPGERCYAIEPANKQDMINIDESQDSFDLRSIHKDAIKMAIKNGPTLFKDVEIGSLITLYKQDPVSIYRKEDSSTTVWVAEMTPSGVTFPKKQWNSMNTWRQDEECYLLPTVSKDEMIDIDESSDYPPPSAFTEPVTWSKLPVGSLFTNTDAGDCFLNRKVDHDFGTWLATYRMGGRWRVHTHNFTISFNDGDNPKLKTCHIDKSTIDNIDEAVQNYPPPSSFKTTVFWKDLPIGALFVEANVSIYLSRKTYNDQGEWLADRSFGSNDWKPRPSIISYFFRSDDEVLACDVSKIDMYEIDEASRKDDISHLHIDQFEREELLCDVAPGEYYVVKDPQGRAADLCLRGKGGKDLTIGELNNDGRFDKLVSPWKPDQEIPDTEERVSVLSPVIKSDIEVIDEARNLRELKFTVSIEFKDIKIGQTFFMDGYFYIKTDEDGGKIETNNSLSYGFSPQWKCRVEPVTKSDIDSIDESFEEPDQEAFNVKTTYDQVPIGGLFMLYKEDEGGVTTPIILAKKTSDTNCDWICFLSKRESKWRDGSLMGKDVEYVNQTPVWVQVPSKDLMTSIDESIVPDVTQLTLTDFTNNEPVLFDDLPAGSLYMMADNHLKHPRTSVFKKLHDSDAEMVWVGQWEETVFTQMINKPIQTSGVRLVYPLVVNKESMGSIDESREYAFKFLIAHQTEFTQKIAFGEVTLGAVFLRDSYAYQKVPVSPVSNALCIGKHNVTKSCPGWSPVTTANWACFRNDYMVEVVPLTKETALDMSSIDESKHPELRPELFTRHCLFQDLQEGEYFMYDLTTPISLMIRTGAKLTQSHNTEFIGDWDEERTTFTPNYLGDPSRFLYNNSDDKVIALPIKKDLMTSIDEVIAEDPKDYLPPSSFDQPMTWRDFPIGQVFKWTSLNHFVYLYKKLSQSHAKRLFMAKANLDAWVHAVTYTDAFCDHDSKYCLSASIKKEEIVNIDEAIPSLSEAERYFIDHQNQFTCVIPFGQVKAGQVFVFGASAYQKIDEKSWLNNAVRVACTVAGEWVSKRANATGFGLDIEVRVVPTEKAEITSIDESLAKLDQVLSESTDDFADCPPPSAFTERTTWSQIPVGGLFGYVAHNDDVPTVLYRKTSAFNGARVGSRLEDHWGKSDDHWGKSDDHSFIFSSGDDEYVRVVIVHKSEIDSIDEATDHYPPPSAFVEPVQWCLLSVGDLFTWTGMHGDVYLFRKEGKNTAQYLLVSRVGIEGWGEHLRSIGSESFDDGDNVNLRGLPVSKERMSNIDESAEIPPPSAFTERTTYGSVPVGGYFALDWTLDGTWLYIKSEVRLSHQLTSEEDGNWAPFTHTTDVGNDSFFTDDHKVIVPPLKKEEIGSIDEAKVSLEGVPAPSEFNIPTTWDAIPIGGWFAYSDNTPHRADVLYLKDSNISGKRAAGWSSGDRWSCNNVADEVLDFGSQDEKFIRVAHTSKQEMDSIDESSNIPSDGLDPKLFTLKATFKDVPVGEHFMVTNASYECYFYCKLSGDAPGQSARCVGSCDSAGKLKIVRYGGSAHFYGNATVFLTPRSKSEMDTIDETTAHYDATAFNVEATFGDVPVGTEFLLDDGIIQTIFRKIDEFTRKVVATCDMHNKDWVLAPHSYMFDSRGTLPIKIRSVAKEEIKSIDEAAPQYDLASMPPTAFTEETTFGQVPVGELCTYRYMAEESVDLLLKLGKNEDRIIAVARNIHCNWVKYPAGSDNLCADRVRVFVRPPEKKDMVNIDEANINDDIDKIRPDMFTEKKTFRELKVGELFQVNGLESELCSKANDDHEYSIANWEDDHWFKYQEWRKYYFNPENEVRTLPEVNKEVMSNIDETSSSWPSPSEFCIDTTFGNVVVGTLFASLESPDANWLLEKKNSTTGLRLAINLSGRWVRDRNSSSPLNFYYAPHEEVLSIAVAKEDMTNIDESIQKEYNIEKLFKDIPVGETFRFFSCLYCKLGTGKARQLTGGAPGFDRIMGSSYRCHVKPQSKVDIDAIDEASVPNDFNLDLYPQSEFTEPTKFENVDIGTVYTTEYYPGEIDLCVKVSDTERQLIAFARFDSQCWRRCNDSLKAFIHRLEVPIRVMRALEKERITSIDESLADYDFIRNNSPATFEQEVALKDVPVGAYFISVNVETFVYKRIDESFCEILAHWVCHSARGTWVPERNTKYRLTGNEDSIVRIQLVNKESITSIDETLQKLKDADTE